MNKRKILIVDDHKEFREGLRVFIEKQVPNVKILEASTGEEGVEMALIQKPEVALIDIQLPKIDGMEAAKRIKQGLPECRIITMSTFGEKKGQSFVSSEITAFIAKAEIDSKLPALLEELL